MRDLPHVIGQVFNTPLMIQGQKLDTVLGAVGARILAGAELGEQPQRLEPRAEFAGAVQRFSGGGYLCGDGIAVLPVLGTLVRRGSWMDAWSGMTSYASISASIYEMMESPAVRGLMLEIDSFGGEAGGCFDLVEEITSIAAEYDKPIWAVASEAAASAAYAIACAADRIYVPQMGVVGSIGVVCAHVDMSKADEKAGLKWTYIYAGEHKIDGNPHEPLPAGVKADLLTDVNQICQMFVAMVAERRGLSADAVRATEAKMYRGSQAVDVGLADELGTFAEAMNAFADHLNGSNTSMGSRQMAAVDKQRMTAMGVTKNKAGEVVGKVDGAAASAAVEGTDDLPETGADEGDPEPEPAAVPPVANEPAADAIAKATAAANGRAVEMNSIGVFAAKHGVTFDANAAIKSSMSVDQARKQVMEAAAAKDDALPTVATPTQTSAAATNNADLHDAAVARAAKRHGLAMPAK